MHNIYSIYMLKMSHRGDALLGDGQCGGQHGHVVAQEVRHVLRVRLVQHVPVVRCPFVRVDLRSVVVDYLNVQ